LITPQLVLGVGSNIAFDVRVAGGGYLDTLQVLMSTTGTAPANFTLLGSYSASTDAGWVPRTVLTGRVWLARRRPTSPSAMLSTTSPSMAATWVCAQSLQAHEEFMDSDIATHFSARATTMAIS